MSKLSVIREMVSKFPLTILTTLSFFLCSLYMTYDSPEYDVSISLMHIVWAFVNTLFFSSLVYLISRISKLIIVLPVILILSLVLTVDLTHVLAYDTRIMFGGIASMFETNKSEALGMSQELLMYAIPSFVICFLFLFFVSKELKNYRLNYFLVFAVLGVCVVALPILLIIKDVNRSDHRKNTFRDYPLFVVQDVLGYRYPLGCSSVLIIAAYLEESRKLKEFRDMPKSLPQGIKIIDGVDIPQTLYILIGESSLRDNYSLYGYNVPTTPFLDSISNLEQLQKYSSLSPACLTRDAIKMTLSFASPHRQEAFYENYNAVELAKLKGYETYWISNHDKLGVYDSNIGFIASSSGYTEFHNNQKDDLDLINIVDSLYNKDKHQVFFIHLKGSHLPYGDKSDKQDDDYLRTFQEADSEDFLYNKSIHHTDKVIETLYHKTALNNRNRSSVIFYYSDHGEIIGTGHGFLNYGVEQFQVPFIIIPHNFPQNWDELVEPYIYNGEFNTVNFINVFAQSIGYSLSDKYIEIAKSDAPYYYHVDRKVYRFDDIKK